MLTILQRDTCYGSRVNLIDNLKLIKAFNYQLLHNYDVICCAIGFANLSHGHLSLQQLCESGKLFSFPDLQQRGNNDDD